MLAMAFVIGCKDPVDSDTDTNTNSGDISDTDAGTEGGLDHDHSLPDNSGENAEDDSIINW